MSDTLNEGSGQGWSASVSVDDKSVSSSTLGSELSFLGSSVSESIRNSGSTGVDCAMGLVSRLRRLNVVSYLSHQYSSDDWSKEICFILGFWMVELACESFSGFLSSSYSFSS